MIFFNFRTLIVTSYQVLRWDGNELKLTEV